MSFAAIRTNEPSLNHTLNVIILESLFIVSLDSLARCSGRRPVQLSRKNVAKRFILSVGLQPRTAALVWLSVLSPPPLHRR